MERVHKKRQFMKILLLLFVIIQQLLIELYRTMFRLGFISILHTSNGVFTCVANRAGAAGKFEDKMSKLTL